MYKSAPLLKALIRSAPFQPATNYWRTVEIGAVLQHGFPTGNGLDLGCGDGKLTAILMQALDPQIHTAIQWVGIDLDPLETAHARAAGLYERVHTCSATKIPEPANSFDFVFSNSVLEHIPPIAETLQEVARLLKPGGKYLFTVPGPDFHSCLAGPLGRGASPNYLQSVDARCAHLRYWDIPTWRKELAGCGLDLTVTREYLSKGQVQRWERLSNLTAGLLYVLLGQRKRPIEIQRQLKMRQQQSGVSGKLMAAISSLFTLGRPAIAYDASGPYGCLLLEGTKRA